MWSASSAANQKVAHLDMEMMNQAQRIQKVKKKVAEAKLFPLNLGRFRPRQGFNQFF